MGGAQTYYSKSCTLLWLSQAGTRYSGFNFTISEFLSFYVFMYLCIYLVSTYHIIFLIFTPNPAANFTNSLSKVGLEYVFLSVSPLGSQCTPEFSHTWTTLTQISP